MSWRARIESWPWVAVLMLVVALCFRAPQFGNPVIQIDEQFYLLVGDRLWSGGLPYVDSWDRKPVGLFLIYAAVRLLGGDGILQYQIVATCFAAATALMVAILASRIAPRPAAVIAGIVYLIFLSANGGDGGQAPVFYNLPVGLAAWSIVRVLERARFDRTAFAQGCAAMVLVGIALQIKYSVLFEGAYFGLALLVSAWGASARMPRLVGAAAAWIALALAPTGIAFASYVALGHADAFVFANFKSIFLRPPYEVHDIGRQVRRIAARMLPVAFPAIIGAARLVRTVPTGAPHSVRIFLILWALIAGAAFAGFGTYHDHYTLPLILPFAIVGAPAYAWLWRIHGMMRRVPVFALLVPVAGVITAYLVVSDSRQRGGASGVRAMAARIAMAPDNSLFVFSGDPILYHLAGSPLPSPWHFPTLLSERRDARSLGTDMHRELARVMATKPRFVVLRDGYPFPEADPSAWTFMAAILKRDYRLIMAQPMGRRQRLLYERKEASERD